MANEREVNVGDVVIAHDPVGKASNALVTAVWGKNCINVVFTSLDPAKTDPYGRQTERYTSFMHGSVNTVHGMYWRFPDEQPNPIVPPLEK